jgi:hypothetical protein
MIRVKEISKLSHKARLDLSHAVVLLENDEEARRLVIKALENLMFIEFKVAESLATRRAKKAAA